MVTVLPATNLQEEKTEFTDKQLDVSLFPNPSEDFVFVTFSGLREKSSVSFEVSDMLSRKVSLSEVIVPGSNRLEIDVSRWPPGQYLARFIIDGKSIVKPFVVIE